MMLISLIVATAVGGMTYAAERAIDRTIQQGRAIKKSGGSIRQTVENVTAGMVAAAVQEPAPQPAPIIIDDADEFDDDEFFCDCDEIVAEEVAPAEEPETTITADVVIEEPAAPVPEQPRDPVSGQFKKKKKK